MRIAVAVAALVVFASLASLPSPVSAQAGLGRPRTPPPEQQQENKKGDEPTQEQAPAQQNEKKKKGKKDQ
jgi:hypothetical protein